MSRLIVRGVLQRGQVAAAGDQHQAPAGAGQQRAGPARCWRRHRAPAAAAGPPAGPATTPSAPAARAGSARRGLPPSAAGWPARRPGRPAAARACARAAARRSARPGTAAPAGARHAPRTRSCRSRPSPRSHECPPPRRHQPHQQQPPPAPRSSCCRPVNEAMSRGSVRVAAAAPPVPASPGVRAPRRRLELRPGRAGQAQRVGQQPGRVLAGGQVDPPLQIADRPRAQARRLRQLLLRQPGLGPQLPQQPAETRRRLLRHGPHRPSPARPAARPGAARRPASDRQQASHPPTQ